MNTALQLQTLDLDVPPRRESAAKENLVLLHGWGCDSHVWRELVPALGRRFRVHRLDLPGVGRNVDHHLWDDDGRLLQALAEVMPARAHFLGWSLGGNLALAFASRYPQRVLSLNLIACNPCFVQRPDWPWAMSEEAFDAFFASVESDPDTALLRFQQLQMQGETAARFLVKQLRAVDSGTFVYSPDALLAALAWLRNQDQRKLMHQQQIPVHYILGEKDGLVPVAIAARLPGVSVLDDVGHVPMLSQPELLLRKVLRRSSGDGDATIDKRRVARSFSRAADSYDAAAQLQRQVGDELASRVPCADKGIALDLGSGTGYFLRQRAGQGELVWFGGDLAEGMLRHTAESQSHPTSKLLALDAEELPLADASLQGIHTNLALQWCTDLESLFAELHRVVKPGGWLVFSTLVDGTLQELRRAWLQVDGHVHVNRFFADKLWRRAAQGSGWRIKDWKLETRTRHYDELRDLLYELKALGAHNVNDGMQTGLTGKRAWRQLRIAYEGFRQEDARLPASWQVLYGVLHRD